MTKTLIPCALMVLGGCATAPRPDTPWRDPPRDDFHSCLDYRSDRWRRLDHPPAEADELRALAR